MEAKDAAGLAQRLVKALEDPKVTDPDRLSNLGEALAALATRLEAKDAAGLADRLVKALEEDPKETDPNRLSSLGEALAALAPRVETKDAAGFAASATQALVKALEDREEIDPDHLSSLVEALAEQAQVFSSTPNTHLFALSNALLVEIPAKPENGEEEPPERKAVTGLVADLNKHDLAEVLKWPFCVGEAEKIVLAELEKKTDKSFGGNVWMFVEQAPDLGIKNLDQPAKRPLAEDALEELKELRAGSAPR